MGQSREDIRATLIGSTPKPKSKEVTVFGCTFDIVQPSFGSILAGNEIEDQKKRGAQMIIDYAFVSGTNEQLFEDTDMDFILRWPFGQEILDLQNAIAELTGLDIEIAEEDIKQNPLEEQS